MACSATFFFCFLCNLTPLILLFLLHDRLQCSRGLEFSVRKHFKVMNTSLFLCYSAHKNLAFCAHHYPPPPAETSNRLNETENCKQHARRPGKKKIFVRNVNMHATDTESDNMVNKIDDGLTLKVDSRNYIF
jgi:hypothetical protein